MDSADTARAGSRSQPPIDRPSVGNAARSIALWTAIRARFVRPSATIDPDRHGLGHPAEPGRDLCCEPALPVDCADEVIDVDDVRLELDHEQGAMTGMPGQDVDDATLAVDRERRLRSERPSRQVIPEHPGNQFMQLRMPGIEQSVQVAGTPSGDQIHPDIERSRHLADRLERQLVHVAALDPRHRRPRHIRRGREVDLPPTLPEPDGPHDRSRSEGRPSTGWSPATVIQRVLGRSPPINPRARPPSTGTSSAGWFARRSLTVRPPPARSPRTVPPPRRTRPCAPCGRPATTGPAHTTRHRGPAGDRRSRDSSAPRTCTGTRR